MIKPTVGRVVLYRPTASDPFGSEAGYPDCRFAALIAHVWNDSCVNLMVSDPNGNTFGRTSVILSQDREAGPGECEWMPYQKQVAAGEIPPVLHAVPKSDPQPETEAA